MLVDMNNMINLLAVSPASPGRPSVGFFHFRDWRFDAEAVPTGPMLQSEAPAENQICHEGKSLRQPRCSCGQPSSVGVPALACLASNSFIFGETMRKVQDTINRELQRRAPFSHGGILEILSTFSSLAAEILCRS